jgi:hypothetical protein
MFSASSDLKNGLQDRQDIPVSSQLNLHVVYVSDGSWSWIRWYVVNDSRKQQVLVVAQSFLDRLGHLGPVELARDQCGKDRDAKCATDVYDQFHSMVAARSSWTGCQCARQVKGLDRIGVSKPCPKIYQQSVLKVHFMLFVQKVHGCRKWPAEGIGRTCRAGLGWLLFSFPPLQTVLGRRYQ